jgi:aryl-alcohol dehydrogenase-like predicted oxidoreductase
MQYTAQLHGWTGFVSMQDQYNLMEREEEREMFGLLADQNVCSIPWGPLGKGRLARPYGQQTARDRRRYEPWPPDRRHCRTRPQAHCRRDGPARRALRATRAQWVLLAGTLARHNPHSGGQPRPPSGRHVA